MQAFRIQYGNPFDIRYPVVSHHCVELIYVFDAFHDALRRVDNESGLNLNTALVENTQFEWINFITSRDTATLAPDDIVIYNSERTRAIENISTSLELIARHERFSVLEKYFAQANSLFNALTSLLVDIA